MKKLFAILFLFITIAAFSQDSSAVKFTFSQQRINDKEVALIITAHTNPSVSFFGLQTPKNNLIFSAVNFDSAAAKYLQNTVAENGNLKTVKDETLGADVSVVNDSVQWIQHIKLASNDSAIIKGIINYVYKKGDEYPSAEEPFKFVVMPEKNMATGTTAANRTEGKSLLWIFIAAFGGGLLALLTPCVYSMVPVTVSFFTKRSKTHKQGILNAIYYSLSIIIIFTTLGFLITFIFGPAALNNLATHWLANILFFLIFVIFGISFLGGFEIELPSSWSNKADSKASTGNFLGIFFMALTLVIVSFSCTGPIIGNLLVLAAKGNYYGPLVGMFGFALALALPFALFAFFPGKLNLLGKAGGWLNAVKVTLGFLELALALKFLSNADLAMNWRILDREVFLALWIVIFSLLGLYLLGKLKFRHDDALPKNDFGIPFLTVTRLFFAIASITLVIYMIPGLLGAPLRGLSAFLPPMGTQDFNADDLPSGYKLGNASSHETDTSNTASYELPSPEKYIDVMKSKEPPVVVNNGLITYFDYAEALAIARKLKRPLMLDFTGVNCINCRHMEGEVWSDPEVMKRLKNNFVIASLFVDVHSGVDLPISEQYYSQALHKNIENLGDKNTDLQVTKFGANSQPFYFFLDANEQPLAQQGYGYDPSVSKFIEHLDKVIEEYKRR